MRTIILAILFLTCVVSPAFALKTLMLDAAPSSYNMNTNPDADVDTIVATQDAFTLYALIDPDKPGYDPDESRYYISTALWPAVDETTPAPDYGSFSFDGVDINVAGDMTFGTPPIANPALAGNVDLQSHSVFETYFAEFEFNLDDAVKSVPYNSQDSPGGFSETTSMTDFIYAVLFDIDVSNLSDDFSIHFDFYTLNYEDILDPDTGEVIGVKPASINEFAAFSHDAQSGGGGGGGGGGGDNPIPEPSTFILLGAGLAGLVFYRRKKS